MPLLGIGIELRVRVNPYAERFAFRGAGLFGADFLFVLVTFPALVRLLAAGRLADLTGTAFRVGFGFDFHIWIVRWEQ